MIRPVPVAPKVRRIIAATSSRVAERRKPGPLSMKPEKVSVQLARGLVALVGVLGERLHHDAVELSGFAETSASPRATGTKQAL
jgi:hypothetical protein